MSKNNRVCKALILSVAFLAGLLGVRAVVAQVTPWEPDGMVGDKLALLEREGDIIDVLFIGSSRTFRGVNPATIDRILEREGLNVASFNFGADQMFAQEAEAVLEYILDELDPASLRWVVISPDLVNPQQKEALAASARVVTWHDVDGTVDSLRAVGSSHRSINLRAEWAYNHLNSYLINATNRGRLLDRLTSQITEGDPNNRLTVGLRGDGFVAYHASGAADDLNQGLLQAHLDFLGGAPILVPEPRPIVEVELDWTRRVDRLVREWGATPIFVTSPGDNSAAWLGAALDEGIIEVALDFNDPERYPELFDRSLWWDRGHLNREGARLYSRLLAGELFPLLSATAP